MSPGPAGRPGRREVLASGALGAAGLLLAGCGLRWESDAPDLPLLPREPYPGLDVLSAERDRTRAALVALSSVGSPAGAPAVGRLTATLAGRLAATHRADVAALDARLAQVGSGADGAATPPASTGSDPASPPASPRSSPRPSSAPPDNPAAGPSATAQVVSAERADLGAGVVSAAVAGAAAADLPVLVAARVGRAGAARLLGAQVPGAPPDPRVPAAVAGRLLDLVAPAVYGLEVAAAQAAPARRETATAAVDALSVARDQLDELAGPAPTPVPLGYRLPFPVTTPAAADRLAAAVLHDLARDLVAACAAVPGDAGALRAIAGWALEAWTWRARWGAAPASLTPPASPS